MKGLIAWFARNDVAANLLMGGILIGGIFTIFARSTLEVFPEFTIEEINIIVPYRGSTPAEVEEGVIVRIEEAIQDLQGIDRLRSTASEGSGRVTVEVEEGTDSRELLDDIKNRVDAISTFPDETERPIYSIPQRRREVISVAVYGELPEAEIRQLGERVRDELTILPGITQADLTEIRPYEISIEISETTLEKYGLTFNDVSTAIRTSSLDLAAGSLKTRGGEILLRTKGQAYVREDFEQIVVIQRSDGTRLTVADIGRVDDGFEEEPLRARFNGKPAVIVEVYRVGDQNAIDVADAVKRYVDEREAFMPPGVELEYWRDRSRIIKARLNTLNYNAIQGAILVVLLLALFLRPSVALWVSLGIPISFMGAFAVMPELGVTINLISLFAFILVLGIVVDDAIVTGENIFRHLEDADDPLQAAIDGTNEVAVPVTFGVLTTVAAFMPLAMIPGVRGQIFLQIPLIVIPVLLFSLIESKLILPAHLKHVHIRRDRQENIIIRLQQKVANGLHWFVDSFYRPSLAFAMRFRYLTIATFVAGLILSISLVAGGHMRFVFFPRVQSETARGNLVMPLGTPFEVTDMYVNRMRIAAEQLRDKYRNPESGESVVKDILATSGSAGSQRGQSHLGGITFEIVAPEEREELGIEISSTELVNEWREMIGVLPGVRELTFRAEIGRSSDPIDIQLSGKDFDQLGEVAGLVKARLLTYEGVFDITDNFQDGKEEIRLRIKPEAELLGLTVNDLARQVRQAFFGQEAQRIQRGQDDVRVMVRYPLSERQSIANLEGMRIRTPSGSAVPFGDVAEATLGRSFATINRVDRRRTINVTADINKQTANMPLIMGDLREYLGEVLVDYPGITYSLEGEAREQRDSGTSLIGGLIFVLGAIYIMLAIPFKSYLQPFIAMAVIPFGIVGAILGHVIMRMDLSIFSIFGMLALIGVVINDSLVLVDFVNQNRAKGLGLQEAVRSAGVRRFRAILLTSLTTFVGLMPLIFDSSTQAQFLIPMAVSLGFGVLFATFITLILVPINYLVLEDVKRLFRWVYSS